MVIESTDGTVLTMFFWSNILFLMKERLSDFCFGTDFHAKYLSLKSEI